jgi:starch synthase (maltosyl-transferring)
LGTESKTDRFLIYMLRVSARRQLQQGGNVTASASARQIAGLSGRRILIENVYPAVEAGRFPVKRIVGEPIEVWADIFRDGSALLAAELLWRAEAASAWSQVRMRLHGNDRWTASFVPTREGLHAFVIEAWTDEFATWRRDFLLKRDAGLDVTLEAREGRALLASLKPASDVDFSLMQQAYRAADGDPAVLLAEEVAEAAIKGSRSDLSRSESFPLMLERKRARTGAWYEMVPRSQGRVCGQHGTFDDCIARLADVAAQGFDVLYLPPIHPIGRTNRKGRNNSLRAEPGDPGSLYAIGSAAGGHDAVHPQLGTLEDFRRLLAACGDHGLEIALDFAVQCSPDHPWLTEQEKWFKRRPDGSIQYAENPPKKYQDIVNPDFGCADAAGLWAALRDIVLFWVDKGVRIFRVDNPHTKPFAFWQWLIREVQAVDPGVIFLSEAFTRPKVMKALAKLGFSQSYTYFTWRTTKHELQAYLSEITGYPECEYFRPNFFVNTPDILPLHLQSGEAWIFKARVALAATLSASYGIYNGFELLEHEPIPGTEEYLDSEKYQIKVRDWNRPGNIKDYIGKLNRLRRGNPALQQTANLRFVQIDDDDVIGFVKESTASDNAVAVTIALAQAPPRQFWLHFGDLEIGPPGERRHVREIENLVTGERHPIEWGGVRLTIDQSQNPALLFRCFP